MSERPKKIFCFDNCPKAIMALGKVTYPVIIKPYECEDKTFWYEASDYGKVGQVLYDAFEYTRNERVVIEEH